MKCAALIVMFAVSGFANTNEITREIFCKAGVVGVRDEIRYPLAASRYMTVLRDMIAAKESSSSAKLHQLVADFFGRDNLRVADFNLSLDHNQFHLIVTSRVVMKNSTVVKLDLLPGYAGRLPIDPASVDTKQSKVEIISDGNARFLWFPEWRGSNDPKGLVAVLLTLSSAADRMLGSRSDLRLRCLLRAEGADAPEVLFDYSPDIEPLKAPPAEMIERLQSAHPISGNDLRRLFTATKVAKAGYYPLSLNHFTNMPPAPVTITPYPDCEEGGLSASDPELTLKLDGELDDWKPKTAWKNTVGAPDTDPETFTLGNILYTNDANYLYVFIKFRPSVEYRYRKLYSGEEAGSLGSIVQLSCDLDSNVQTGCDKQARNRGAEIELIVHAGGWFQMFQNKILQTGPVVSYQLKIWDANEKSFVSKSGHNSRAGSPLISHGKDGVEMAVKLSELGVVPKIKLVAVPQNLESGDFMIKLVDE